MTIPIHRLNKFTGYAMAIAMTWSCAPQRPYRAPTPPSSAPATSARVAQPPAVPPPAPPVETARKPLPQESKIREQDIRATPAPSAAPKDVKEPVKPAGVSESRSSTEAPASRRRLPTIAPCWRRLLQGYRRSVPRLYGSPKRGASCWMPGIRQRR